RSFSTTRKELLAIIESVKHYGHYLFGRHVKFTVRTDHNASQPRSFKEPVGQIARWLEFLSEFDFVVEHRPGKSRANADLPRRPSAEGSPDNTKHVVEEMTVNANVDNGKCVMAVSKENIEEGSSWIPRMSEDQIRQA
ncbi:Retrovirus-related Pol poly from transposon, partial [Paramuricea clavata]